jgi:hypothetical protein
VSVTVASASIEEFRASPFIEVVEMGAVPPMREKTIMVEAGAVSFGVEYRYLTGRVLTEVYGAEVAKRAMANRFGVPDLDLSTPIDSGVSVHVFDSATGEERLRFDDLDQACRHPAHYHYMGPDGRHALGWFDPAAEGVYMSWVLDRLRTRLPDMLAFAGAGDLAASVDTEAIEAALPRVAAAVEAQAAAAAAGTA